MGEIDEVVQLRQQALTQFFPKREIYPRVYARRQRALHFTPDAYLLTHPLFLPCLAHLQVPSPRTIEETVSSVMGQRLQNVTSFDQTQSQVLLNINRSVNHIAVDGEDALVAVGHGSGVVSVYDSDELHLSLRQK